MIVVKCADKIDRPTKTYDLIYIKLFFKESMSNLTQIFLNKEDYGYFYLRKIKTKVVL